jgi:hypothetical protein
VNVSHPPTVGARCAACLMRTHVISRIAAGVALVTSAVVLLIEADRADVAPALLLAVLVAAAPVIVPRPGLRAAAVVLMAAFALGTSVGPAYSPVLVLLCAALLVERRPHPLLTAAALALACLAAVAAVVSVANAAGPRLVAHGVSRGGTPWRLSAWGSREDACLRVSAKTLTQSGARAWHHISACGLTAVRDAPLGATIFTDCPAGDTLLFGVVPQGIAAVEVRWRDGTTVPAQTYRADGRLRAVRFYAAERPSVAELRDARALDRMGRVVDVDRLSTANPLCPTDI